MVCPRNKAGLIVPRHRAPSAAAVMLCLFENMVALSVLCNPRSADLLPGSARGAAGGDRCR